MTSKLSRGTATAALLGCLALPAPSRATINSLPGGNDNPYMNRHAQGGRELDRSALRAEVDETETLFAGLAQESRALERPRLEPLFKSLKDEYHLGDQVSAARRALAFAETALNTQDAIKAEEAREKSAVGTAADPLTLDQGKMPGLRGDLASAQDHLRETLREIHRDANADVARDLRNWIMISEGLLRRQREDAESAATPIPMLPASPVVAGSPRPATATAGTPAAKRKKRPL